MKPCVNCKNFKVMHGLANCIRGKPEIDPITGYAIPDYKGCTYERGYGYILSRSMGKCGKEGRFHEEDKQ